MSKNELNLGVGTICTHAGYKSSDFENLGNPVVPPISLTTTFSQHIPGEYKYDYIRGNNPTREILENALAKLENAKSAMTFSSGMAAVNAVCQILQAGQHMICSDDLYGGTRRLITTLVKNFNIESSFVNMTDLSNLKSAFKDNTAMVLMETPSNPLMKVIDIKESVKIIKSNRPNCIVVVDNTFMTPIFQKPLDLGVDIVLHSITKYINGHSDVLMGALLMNDEQLAAKVKFVQFASGAVPSPFDCYLVIRSIRTLHVRMERHMTNGLAVAKFLESHPNIEKVIHPGLESHPQHKLALQQMKGFCGVISFYLKSSDEAALKFPSVLKIFEVAESLGGYESLIQIPSIMTHASVPKDKRLELGITDNLFRISVGLENSEDLIDDLKQALDKLI